MRKGLREGGLLTMTFLAWPSPLAFTELTDLALEKEPNSESGRRECKWVKSLLPLASSTTRKRLVYKLIPSYSERQMNIENPSNCGNAHLIMILHIACLHRFVILQSHAEIFLSSRHRIDQNQSFSA